MCKDRVDYSYYPANGGDGEDYGAAYSGGTGYGSGDFDHGYGNGEDKGRGYKNGTGNG